MVLKQKTKTECHQILLTHNHYYQKLSEINQQRFRIRTLLFLKTTSFNSDPHFSLNQTMKIMISSAFVQITFGLKIDTLDEFNHIFITPQSYSYKNNPGVFDGDVNLYTKKINMSWPAIKRGFDIPDDALNLCIHEFGHCLIFENSSKSYLQKIFKEKDFINWKKHAENKFEKIKANNNKVLRNYAGTNMVELFSVALESFFEQPDFFENHEPDFYLSMCNLLKQDPRNTLNPILNKI